MGPLRSFSWCMKKEQNKAKHKYISLGGKKRPEKKQRHEPYLSGEIEMTFLLYTFPVGIMSAYFFENCNYPLHTKNMLILPLKCCKHPHHSLSEHWIILQILHPNSFPQDQGRPLRHGGLALWVEEPPWPVSFSQPPWQETSIPAADGNT